MKERKKKPKNYNRKLNKNASPKLYHIEKSKTIDDKQWGSVEAAHNHLTRLDDLRWFSLFHFKCLEIYQTTLASYD